MYDYMEKEYTPFEQNLALAWASGNFPRGFRKTRAQVWMSESKCFLTV